MSIRQHAPKVRGEIYRGFLFVNEGRKNQKGGKDGYLVSRKDDPKAVTG